MTGNSHKGSPAIGRLQPADRRADMQNGDREPSPVYFRGSAPRLMALLW